MAKILVIYHSQQFGNTRILAEALAEGAREDGAEVVLINTNEHRVTLQDPIISRMLPVRSRRFSTTSTNGTRRVSLLRGSRPPSSTPMGQVER